MTTPAPATPTRRLFDPNPATQHKYIPAVHTSRDGILAQWKRAQQEQPK